MTNEQRKFLAQQNTEQNLEQNTQPSAVLPAPSREEVWIRAWCAVASTEACTTREQATRWDDACLNAFDQVFNHNE